jgi:maltoporin
MRHGSDRRLHRVARLAAPWALVLASVAWAAETPPAPGDAAAPAPATPPTVSSASAPPQTPPVQAAPAEDAAKPAAAALATGFYAGSYGRVQASMDLAGGAGTGFSVARFKPRLENKPYMELDLGWRMRTEEGAEFDVLITPALSGDLFHYDGNFGEALALRNFYAQAKLPGKVPVTAWAGSRMYRGDDIYLLDFWPMDNLNTFGGGVMVDPTPDTQIAVHAGVNRLSGESYQLQTVTMQVPGDIDGEQVVVLDRQRLVTSLRAHHHFQLGKYTLRAKLYGELHTLPAGEEYIEAPFQELGTRKLPNDFGALGGAQLSFWGWAPQSFAHLWVRHSTGLAAYGELTIPVDGLDADLRARDASSTMIATTGNTESKYVGVMWGAYASYSQDADGLAIDFDDRWDVAAVLRPNVYLHKYVAIGVELSHQYVRPNGLNPRSGTFDQPNITKLALLPGIQLDKGGYSRPRIQFIYQASFLDDDARRFFPAADVRLQPGVQHFLGLGAEWWVNSQRVITPVGL